MYGDGPVCTYVLLGRMDESVIAGRPRWLRDFLSVFFCSLDVPLVTGDSRSRQYPCYMMAETPFARVSKL